MVSYIRKRYNLSYNKVSGESQAVDDSIVQIRLSKLKGIIEEYNSCNIFNADETDWLYNMKPDET